MLTLTRRSLIAAVATLPLLARAGLAESHAGLISIIVTDPANPYWFTEGEVAKATAESLGYKANVAAHKGDTNVESTLIDTAITNKSVAIILDPANADGSIGAVKKAVDAGIPVFLVNAEINQEGLAKAQLVSNNAQGAALGAEQWISVMGDKGTYVELFGNPADNNAATRSNGYTTVISQYPDMVQVGKEVANWDRTQGYQKMQSLLQAKGYSIAPFICYEVVYPEFAASLAAQSDILLTVSNDAWFGRSIGPLQHLQMAQMRALEAGRWMIRATNNGVTVLIDPQGRITERIPAFEQAVLYGEVTPMQGLTPFLQWRSWPLIVLCTVLLGWALWRRKNTVR
ncbi:MAG: hypothetical protein B7Z23_03525 [Pseudomonadales bacterium 32-61-5]|nr:MAG: hypothetical protein B7Z23_03525 [Pseudomonadales bacterium 32-61-5]